jgi:hypothetical protein
MQLLRTHVSHATAPHATAPQDLVRYFEPFGKVVAAKVVRDGRDGRSRGFGFVAHSAVEETDKVRCVCACLGARHADEQTLMARLTSHNKCRRCRPTVGPPRYHPSNQPPTQQANQPPNQPPTHQPQAIQRMDGEEIQGRKVSVERAKSSL